MELSTETPMFIQNFTVFVIFEQTLADDQDSSWIYYMALDYIGKVVLGIIIILGIIGNILSFLVMNRKQLRTSVTSLYFR